MSERADVLLLGVGGGAGQIVDRIAASAGKGLRAVAMDTDAIALAGLKCAEARLLGAVRLEGVGAGGDPVNGRLAAQDDVSIVRETVGGVRFLVTIVSLGGGTGSGAAPEILSCARKNGVTTLCFALLPFGFEGRRRLAAAERVVPLLEDASDTLVVLQNDALYADAAEVPLAEALRRAAEGVESGVLMIWRMLSRPGFIRLDERALRTLLCRGGPCRYAFVSARGENRAREVVRQLVGSPGLRDGEAMAEAGAVLVCIEGGEDLRLREISEIMSAIETNTGSGSRVSLGTVLDPEAIDILRTTVLVFEKWTDSDAAPAPAPSSGLRKPPRSGSKLSFGATGRGRFHDIEPTVVEGADMDVPAYIRRGIALEP